MRAAFWKLAEQAKEQGKDLAEVLDRAGLLLTPKLRRKIQADTIFLMADGIEAKGPARMLKDAGFTRGTPADMHRIIVEDLNEQGRKVREAKK